MTVTARYPTDMNDEQWMVVRPILERVGKPGRPLRYALRSIFNGCLYITREGCSWRSLPKDAYPPWTVVYRHFQRWSQTGQLEKLTHCLNQAVRKKGGVSPPPAP